MHLSTKQFLQILNEPHLIEEIRTRRPVHEQIEIAVFCRIATSYGAEYP